jgi:selenocysteine-specific elongation factor
LLPGVFQAVRQLDCRLTLLRDAKPLKHRAPVHFHSGTAEIEAEVRLLDGSASLAPGAEGWARILLREPALLLPGDRFIIRMFSPVATIGGGAVVDIAPEAEGRLRGGRDALIARLQTLSNPDLAARVALLVREAGYGMTMAGLIARTGASEQEIRAAAGRAGIIAIGRAEGSVSTVVTRPLLVRFEARSAGQCRATVPPRESSRARYLSRRTALASPRWRAGLPA